MVHGSCILVSLILSSCSIEYGVKKYLIDSKGYRGISVHWDIAHCFGIWSFSPYGITTCFPKDPDEGNCTVLSASYNIRKVKELYVNIKTLTRSCAKINFFNNCTGKFNLSVHYQKNVNDFERVIIPDVIPKKKIQVLAKDGAFMKLMMT